MSVVALVAAKNAADSIAATVTALAALPVDSVLVVDDGSDDQTAMAAAEAGARVVRLHENVGKGGALAAGLAATPDATRYLLADADLGDTASGLERLLRPEAALVIGVLPSAGGRGGFGLVKRVAAAGIMRACGLSTQAPLSGQRCVDGPLLRSLRLAPRFGVEVGMTIDVVRRGGQVVEVPVDVDHRHTGRTLAGFRHRARQGADILAALLPRLSSARQRIVAVVSTAVGAVLLLSGLSAVSAAPHGDPLPEADRVVLFAFDHLGLSDVEDPALPALQTVVREGVVGALSVRTTDRRSLDRRGGPERPSPADAYASLGASARVRAPEALATAALTAQGLPRSVMTEARRRAEKDRSSSYPGRLGDALRAAGKRTAIVTGAQFVDGRTRAGYPAAAAIADGRGRIDRVEIAGPLTSSRGPLDGGLRASIPSFVAAAADAVDDAEVVLVDPGEAALPAATKADRRATLRYTDSVLGALRAALPPRTLLVVFVPTPPGEAWELTPIALYNEGIRPGTVASPSTRREALGVLTDLSPTVLSNLGVPVPAEMTGASLRSAAGTFDGSRFQKLTDDGAVRARFFLPASVGYTVAALGFYLLLIGAMATGVARRWTRALRGGCFAAGAFPLAMLLTGALQHWAGVGGESPGLLVAICVALGALASRGRGLAPMYAMAFAVVGLIALDVAVTGPLHAASLLGYSLQTTGRFYGLPNASFAVFAASLLLVAAWAAGGLRAASPTRAAAGTAVLAAGFAIVAAPWLGNDIGGTLALAPVGVALGWSFFGRRFTRRGVVGGMAATALVLVAAGGLAIAFGSGGHLARAVGGGENSFTRTLAQRVENNLGLLVDQWWGFLVLLLALAGLVAASRGVATHELPARAPLRNGLVAALGLSVLAFAANDSGPVVAVLCLVVVAPVVALRAIDAARPEQSRR